MARPKTVNETARAEVWQLRLHYRFDEGGVSQNFTINPTMFTSGTAEIIQASNIGIKAAEHVIGVLSSLCSVKQVTSHVRGSPGDGMPSLYAPMRALNDGATPPVFRHQAFNQRLDCFLYNLYTIDAMRSSVWVRGLDDALVSGGAQTWGPSFGIFFQMPYPQPANPLMTDTVYQLFDKWIKWIMVNTCHCRPNPAYNGTTVLDKWLTSPWLYGKFDKVGSRKVGAVYGASRGRRRIGA